MKAKPKKLAVIILHYRAEKFLFALLNDFAERKNGHLVNKTGLHPIEMVIVDNHSPLAIRRRLRRFLTNWSLKKKNNRGHYWFLETKDLTVKYLETRRNLGFAAGNNFALKYLDTAKYLLFLNPDTRLTKGLLPAVFSFMEKHPRVGAVSPRLILGTGQLDEACHRGFPTPWRAFCYFSGLERIFPHSHLFAGYHLGWLFSKKRPYPLEVISGAFFWVRFRAGQQVGWWDEDYFFYGEDIDFCYRLKKQGWLIYFLPHLWLRHYRGIASGLKKHSRKMSTADLATRRRAAVASVRAMEIFYRKHYQALYPGWLTFLVMLALRGLKIWRVWRVSWQK